MLKQYAVVLLSAAALAGTAARADTAQATPIPAVATAATVAQQADWPPDAQPVELRFRDLFRTPIAARGLEPTPTLLALNGRKVRMTGYMVAREDMAAGSFLFTPMPVRMSEHADGEANDLPASTVLVLMPEDDRERVLTHVPGLLQLTGTLEWGRNEAADGSVSWLRLKLDSRGAQ